MKSPKPQEFYSRNNKHQQPPQKRGLLFCLWSAKKIFFAVLCKNSNLHKNHCIAVYIIKPQGKSTLTRDEMQGRLADLDDMHDVVVMICQACGFDKKNELIINKSSFFFGAGGGTRTRTMSPPTDFESVTSANSITPAY